MTWHFTTDPAPSTDVALDRFRDLLSHPDLSEKFEMKMYETPGTEAVDAFIQQNSASAP